MTHDIFLSYAHNDNTAEGAKPRWVKSFGEQLSAKLLKQCGEAVDVWWDQTDLDRSQVFDEVIAKAVKSSAICVSLVSRSYIKRPYCKQELEWFAGTGDLKTRSGHLRVFAVLLHRMPFDQWPPACQGTSGFEFFDPQFEGWSHAVDVDTEDFDQGQWKLVSELAKVLDEMRQLGAPASGPAVVAQKAAEPVAAGGFRVFLGCASDELAPDRAFLKKQLQNNGVEVITKIPPPHDEAGHDAAATKAIAEADLSVHLLGDSPGPPFDEDNPDRTYTLSQANIGLQRAKSQLVLLPEALTPELIPPGPYADFLRDLQARPRQPGKLQVIKAGRQQFLEEILNVKKSMEEKAALAAAANEVQRTAFVDLHLKDLQYVADLIGYLAQKKITAVTVPSAEQSPTAGMAMFEQYLKTSQLFIVVFGQVARNWVVNRVSEAFKLIVANGFDTKMGIYVAPPDKPDTETRFAFCEVMKNSSRFDPSTLDGLLGDAGAGARQ